MELQPEPFHLRTLIADTMRPMHLRGSARGLEVSWAVDDRLPAWIAGDKGRLRQVLLNLVGNSIKFTDSGWVRLEVTSMGPATSGEWRIRFVVSDTGIGIAQEKLDGIFEPFTQLPRNSRIGAGGTGLGLSISNKLVELMGGRIFAASSTGAGSAFSFTIDLPAAAHSVPETPHSTASGAPGKPRTQLSVLVAEDHPVNQKLIQGMLKKAGHDCLIVPDGRAAVDCIREGRFDLALMDVQMPELDGIEATRQIRSEELDSGKRLPIIAMTAHAMPGDRERCIEAGMDGYLSKPIRLDTLLSEIERILQVQPADQDRNQSKDSGGEQEKMNPLVDSEAALARVGGDAQLLAELADLFLIEYPRLLEKTRQGLELGDFERVGSSAHQLKGLLAQFGCEAGRAASLRLESASKAGQLEEAGNAAAELERLLSAARPELETLAQAGHSGD
jgi:CheY-like chemotaxis protein/HPt (histidine-containing phosphotransfer) domain-containing protein